MFHCPMYDMGMTVLDKTDGILLQRARHGDDDAFRALVEKYETTVAATVFGMLGRCPEADDVGQETFIRFYNSMDRFRGEANLGTYLTRIAINLSLNELKRRKRRFRRFVPQTEELARTIPDPGVREYDDRHELVRRAIYELKPEFRSVVVLRLIDGYSTRETAEILKLPQGTVLSRLARAQKKLKKLLKPYWGDDDEKERSSAVASGL